MLCARILPALAIFVVASAAADLAKFDYRVLATTRTSTMEKEMNEAADAGYSFAGVMGGQTGFGGKEVVVVMRKNLADSDSSRKKYKLLATSRTGTMQKEIQQAGDEGFQYLGQTVAGEVIIILQQDPEAPRKRYEYKLLATSKTSTIQKELQQAGEEGFEFLGITVAKTAFGGSETVCILRKALE